MDVPQGSPEWLSHRGGLLTASRAGDMLAVPKVAGKGTRADYALELACERLTGRPADGGFVSVDMQRGTDLEPAARWAYESLTGRIVTQTGFLRHNIHKAGVSLDGHVGDFERLVEFKCPKSRVHLGYIRAGKVPSEYMGQVTHSLWMTGAPCLDFLSYDEKMPSHLQTFLVTIYAKDIDLAGYEAKALKFLEEVEALTAELAAM